MPEYEILHSGQYWQDLRRRVKETKAACDERRDRGAISPPGDDGYIYTFVPGHAQPYTSVRNHNGRIVHVAGPSRSAAPKEGGRVSQLVAQRKAQLEAERKGRAERAKQLQQRAAGAEVLSWRV
ncbi:hypothetical protein K438DRAFT_1788308 [Mycena galopus ATCC 62051]|nr:hypothetical protein K438DRAFT_1788308 [Mycena galopus ATCC 62051]